MKMAGVDYDVEYLRGLGVRQLPYITQGDEVIGGLEELKKQLFK